MIEKHEHINKSIAESNLTTLINGEIYNHEEILLLCDNILKNSHGISYFDFFVIKIYINNLYKKLNRKLNILEIGCGTSSRFMTNLGHNVKTYALSDDHQDPLSQNGVQTQKYNFNRLDVTKNKEIIIDEFKKCDLFF